MKSTLPALSTLLLSESSGSLTIWLNRPERRNALSDAMSRELRVAFEFADTLSSARSVVLRGRGGNFCSGADLQQMGAIPNRAAVIASSESGGELFRMIEEFPKPVVALLEGAAVAGGLGLACAADIVVATADTKFALTETRVGLVPAQIAPIVVARIGPSKMRHLALTGSRFDARSAYELGLVHVLADDSAQLEQLGTGIVRQISHCSPAANRASKRLIRECTDWDRTDRCRLAAEYFADALLSEEGQEGLRAFAERRAPAWVESIEHG